MRIALRPLGAYELKRVILMDNNYVCKIATIDEMNKNAQEIYPDGTIIEVEYYGKFYKLNNYFIYKYYLNLK